MIAVDYDVQVPAYVAEAGHLPTRITMPTHGDEAELANLYLAHLGRFKVQDRDVALGVVLEGLFGDHEVASLEYGYDWAEPRRLVVISANTAAFAVAVPLRPEHGDGIHPGARVAGRFQELPDGRVDLVPTAAPRRPRCGRRDVRHER